MDSTEKIIRKENFFVYENWKFIFTFNSGLKVSKKKFSFLFGFEII